MPAKTARDFDFDAADREACDNARFHAAENMELASLAEELHAIYANHGLSWNSTFMQRTILCAAQTMVRTHFVDRVIASDFVCTRLPGHTGRHVAGSYMAATIFHSWERDDDGDDGDDKGNSDGRPL